MALLVAVLCGCGIEAAMPPPFYGVGIFATMNDAVQTISSISSSSSDDFFATLPTRTLTLFTAAPPPTLTPPGLPWTLSTFVLPTSVLPPEFTPPFETVTVTATNVSTTATSPSSSGATTASLSTSSTLISPAVPVTTITVSPLPASPSAEPTGSSYTSASKTTSDLGINNSAVLTPHPTAPSNTTATTAGKRKSLSRAQKIAAIVAPILGLILVAIAVAVGYWLRIRRRERQRADRLEQRARWFRQDHNDWIRAQMSSFDDSKVGLISRNPCATPTPSSTDTICRPRTRPRPFSGSTVVVSRPEEALVDRVVRRRGGVEDLRD